MLSLPSIRSAEAEGVAVGEGSMTRAVYVVGGAGAGKSTFTSRVMDLIVLGQTALTDLHALPNKKNIVTFRGHQLTDFDGRSGLYIGVMRDHYPGTDGLDRASSPVGAAWLRQGNLPDFIIGEGATLSTRPFITALHETTELLLVHLFAEEFVKEIRFMQRGSDQQESFVRATATRAANLTRDMAKIGVEVWEADTADPTEWAEAIDVVCDHLRPPTD